jgi:GT2 family glycosyltransferase
MEQPGTDENKNLTGNGVAAIVVTHNRKSLLVECISDVLNQSNLCDIIIVDNASSDGTDICLRDHGFLNDDRVHYLALDENEGGAGGFYYGIKYAMSGSWKWFWLMDDDAKPERRALENLVRAAEHRSTIYGSVAVSFESGKKRLCWPAVSQRNNEKFIEYHAMLHELEEVAMVPFLGFFIHRDMVKKIGFPDPLFFICCDDKEYSERAKKQGARLYLVKSSIIIHPFSNSIIYRFLNIEAAYRSLLPWKIYYDVRNKILIAREYFGYRVWTQTLPGIIWRAILNVVKEDNRYQVLAMHLKAIVDGLLNRKGKIVLPPTQ